MNLKITAYSTALFSTWIFIEELGCLFDAGDGVAAGLMQKSRKIKHVFVSHADRDHLTGLFQLNQLNAREGYPIIYYPKDCGSFPKLAGFTKKFDPHVAGTVWKPLINLSEINVKNGFFVQAITNNHVETKDNLTKSFGFKLFETKKKLKKEFQGLDGNEIVKIKEEKGVDFTTETKKTNILSYSGDTGILDYETWDNSHILIHEATFFGGDEGHISPHGNKHSTLEEVLKMVSEIKVDKLILSHFSSRYSDEQIDERIISLCKKYKVKIPVWRILPGTIERNILSKQPINC